MPIEKIVELELRGPGPPGRSCTPITVYFHDKTKSLRKIFDGLLFTAKILLEAIYLHYPTWTKSLTKFNTEM